MLQFGPCQKRIQKRLPDVISFTRHKACQLQAYISINASNGDGEHAIKVGRWHAEEGYEVSGSKYGSKESSLDRTTNKTVEHRICPLETGLSPPEQETEGGLIRRRQ